MKKVVIARIVVLVMGLFLSLAPLAVSAQCVMCKTQVEAARSESDEYDVSSLNKGILYMMTVPYLLIGAVGYFWYRRTHPKPKAE